MATEEGAHAEVKPLMTKEQVAFLAKLMVLLLLLCAYLWGTESLPLGATDLLVAVIMYVFAVLPINDIARAYMQDAVFFIFGILAVAVGVSKTGLDKRIGLILLRHIKSTKAFAFIFYPAISIAASFLSEHALVALLIPVLMGVYKVTCRMYGVEKDRALALFLVLGHVFRRQPRRAGLPGRRRPQRHHGRLPDGQRDPDHFRAMDDVRHALCSGGLGLHRILHVSDAPAQV